MEKAFLFNVFDFQDVLSVILRTFQSECQKKLNAKRKFEFDRFSSATNVSPFKRAQWVLSGSASTFLSKSYGVVVNFNEVRFYIIRP